MPRLDWVRIAVGGLVAGLVWTLLSLVLLGIAGREFMAVLTNGAQAPGGNVQAFMFLSNLAAAVWGTWLYALRSRAQDGSHRRVRVVDHRRHAICKMGRAWNSSHRDHDSTGPANSAGVLVAAIAGGWCYENFRLVR